MLILIDNYDSFTYNLVHYFEEIGQSVRVFRNDEISVEKIFKLKPRFLVISPGPSSPKNSGICLELIKKNSEFSNPIPMLGVCLGHQAIAEAFGGKVIQSGKPVHGKVSKIYHESTKLFRNINNPFNATRYHSLIVKKNSIPKNFNITASIEDGTVMAIEHTAVPIFGVQFHPESIATDSGHQLLKNFLTFNAL
ncbi:MAG: anthranilate/aminodeoxychorismate synthase component II [Rickettsiales bacterium]|nr:anthranilate/aminodeoxychorismate synthase component II [Rickettsiales bacterium]|tara:strand:- start:732 stop:1313 length:582 start_codon:yes stop_codon:yes gene_type:complete